VEDVQWTNQFDLELDCDLKSSIDQDEHLGHLRYKPIGEMALKQ